MTFIVLDQQFIFAMLKTHFERIFRYTGKYSFRNERRLDEFGDLQLIHVKMKGNPVHTNCDLDRRGPFPVTFVCQPLGSEMLEGQM